jgi:uncharacterized protein HemX
MRRLCALVPILALLAVTPAVAQQATTPAPTATTGVPSATPAPSTAPAATPTAAPTTSSTAASQSTGGGPNGLLVALALVLGLGALSIVLWGLARVTAWEPEWWPDARHTLGEATYRAGATWSEFRDWMRPRPRR